MRFWSTLHRGSNKNRSIKAKARPRLVLERLEDRCLLSGATLTVNTLADVTGNNALSLREAVGISQGDPPVGTESTQINGNPSGGNDTIVFSAGLSGTIVLTLGELNGAAALSQNVTIDGPGASLLAVEGVGTQILNNGTAGIDLTIAGLTIKDGFNGGPGGAILNNGSLTLTNDIFTNNISSIGGGGAIADVAAGGVLNVTGTTFTDNSATGSGGGGAVFSPGAGTTMTFTNCTFSDDSEAGAGGGGAIFSSGAGNPLTITDGIFTDNVATGSGGAINSDAASQLLITGSVFTSNDALNGGAVAATGSAAQTIGVINTSFSDNSAIGGTAGGGALDIQGNTSTVTISGSSFSENLSNSMGGAISSGFNTGATGTGLSIDNSTFSGNRALSSASAVEGGAFFDTNSPKLSITDSQFSGNFATSSTSGQGGALYLNASGAASTPALIENVTISGNAATTAGGGIFVTDGTLSTISFTNISNNTANNGGGLDIADNSVATVSQSTVSGNTATNDGGGVYNTATFNLNRSTVSGNTSENGGGIFSNSVLTTNLTVINSTVANNVATIGNGGGIYSNDVGAVLVNSTIALNEAGGSGGGLYEATAGGVTLTNTIVALNTKAGAASDIGGAAVVGTSSNNLIGTGGSGGLTNTNGNQIGVSNPGLDPRGLQNNGGPTQTIALIAGSPAINGGTISVLSAPYDLTTDQRGFSRESGGGVDVGAYQYNSITPLIAEIPNGGVSDWNGESWTVINTQNATLLASTSAGDAVAEFAGQGVWFWNGTVWAQIQTADASALAISNSNTVVADFAGTGVWEWNGATWTQIKSNDASLLAIGENGVVVGNFYGVGVWLYSGASWSRIGVSNVDALAITSDTNEIVASFLGNGLFQRSFVTGVWTELNTLNASALAVGSNDTFIANFNGSGVYLYAGGTFTRIITVNTTVLAMSAATNTIYASFPGGPGVFQLSPARVWQEIGTTNAASILEDGSAFTTIAEFPGAGVSVWNDSVWTNVNVSNASILASNNEGDAVAVFSGVGAPAGVYFWNGAAWSQISTSNATALAIASDTNTVVADFAGGVSQWNFNTNTWTLINPNQASLLAIGNNDAVVGNFPGAGVQLYSGSPTWNRIGVSNVNALAISSDTNEIVASFVGNGLFQRNFLTGVWTELNTLNASEVSIGSNDTFVANFNGSGVYLYNGGTGMKINVMNATALAISATTGTVYASLAGETGVYQYPVGGSWTNIDNASATIID